MMGRKRRKDGKKEGRKKKIGRKKGKRTTLTYRREIILG
jgi:hypothetical protein